MASSLTFSPSLALPLASPCSKSVVSQPCSAKFPTPQLYGAKLSSPILIRPPSAPAYARPLTVAKVSKGDVAPTFTLKDQDGKPFDNAKYKGKPLVLYFYPADESPSCTKQACAFRDAYEKFKKAGAEVVGISGDSAESHAKFIKKNKLPFTLLCDEGNKVRKEWGIPSDLFGALPGRQTYVIDKKGVVQLVFNNQFQPEKHIGETLKILQSM